MAALFKLGQVVMSSGIAALMQDKQSELYNIDLSKLLYRHQRGDDGEVGEEDHQSNQLAIEQGGLQIMSVYKFAPVTVWIITEHDRSYTTILLPEDY